MSVCAERPCDADRGGNGDPAMDPSKRERRRTKNGQRRAENEEGPFQVQ